jgi:2-polyprenyl-6-hydroxyphenyl methylase/3-demethylubiquinone-9 3-methyltransferase
MKITDRNKPLKKVKILDVGCGGGLLSEPMCRMGADVTAIDASKKNIEIAKIHAKKDKLKIKYICTSPDNYKTEIKYDVILNMEIVEHVEDINFFIKSCSKLLKKNGIMFVATLNKTLKSYLFAILGAEYFLRWLPIGTHDWEKFIKPEDLIDILKKNNLTLDELHGMKFDLIKDQWNLSSDKSVNYIAKFIKD